MKTLNRLIGFFVFFIASHSSMTALADTSNSTIQEDKLAPHLIVLSAQEQVIAELHKVDLVRLVHKKLNSTCKLDGHKGGFQHAVLEEFSGLVGNDAVLSDIDSQGFLKRNRDTFYPIKSELTGNLFYDIKIRKLLCYETDRGILQDNVRSQITLLKFSKNKPGSKSRFFKSLLKP